MKTASVQGVPLSTDSAAATQESALTSFAVAHDQYFAVAYNQWIVTANADGSIPLNAKAVCRIDEVNSDLMAALLRQANRKIP